MLTTKLEELGGSCHLNTLVECANTVIKKKKNLTNKFSSIKKKHGNSYFPFIKINKT